MLWSCDDRAPAVGGASIAYMSNDHCGSDVHEEYELSCDGEAVASHTLCWCELDGHGGWATPTPAPGNWRQRTVLPPRFEHGPASAGGDVGRRFAAGQSTTSCASKMNKLLPPHGRDASAPRLRHLGAPERWNIAAVYNLAQEWWPHEDWRAYEMMTGRGRLPRREFRRAVTGLRR